MNTSSMIIPSLRKSIFSTLVPQLLFQENGDMKYRVVLQGTEEINSLTFLQ